MKDLQKTQGEVSNIITDFWTSANYDLEGHFFFCKKMMVNNNFEACQRLIAVNCNSRTNNLI
jgi:hypothetical protein